MSISYAGAETKIERGLVLSSKSDRSKSPCTYKLAQYAGSIETSVKHNLTNQDNVDWCNGRAGRPIQTFSKKSRNNMFKALAKMRVAWETAYFLTLTYDGLFNQTPERVKRDISAFRKRLERRYPLSGGIWRMEIKERLSGASQGEDVPHFHIILFGAIDNIEAIRQWLSRSWNEIIDGSKDHLIAGTNCQKVKNRKHASYYVSKYAGKLEDKESVYIDKETGEIHNWGRRWAVFGSVDQEESIVLKLTRQEFVIFKRFMVRWLRNKNRNYSKAVAKSKSTQGFTMFSFGEESVSVKDLCKIVRHCRELASVNVPAI